MPRTDHALATPVLPSLTGLRWVAAFGVFVYHVRNLGYFDGSAQGVFGAVVSGGDTGVSLFFMLSGFVLAWSDRPGGDDGAPVRSAIAFWRRRAARIWPLHVVTVIAAVLVAATVMPTIRTASPKALLANLLLVSSWHAPWWQAGNPVSWSLVCEAFFYLVFPLVIRSLRRADRVVLGGVAVVCVFSILVMPAVVGHLPGALDAASWPPARFPEFLLGVTAACAMRSGWRGPRLPVPVLLTLAGVLAADLHPSSRFALTGFTAVGFGLLLPALARADVEGRVTGLSSRPMVALGARSFAFYLVHLLTIDVVLAFRPEGTTADVVTGVVMTVLALVVALASAWMLHDLVEVPVRRFLLRPRHHLLAEQLFRRGRVSVSEPFRNGRVPATGRPPRRPARRSAAPQLSRAQHPHPTIEGEP